VLVADILALVILEMADPVAVLLDTIAVIMDTVGAGMAVKKVRMVGIIK
jgi:hypothetical protein